MRENADQNNSKYGHFLRSEQFLSKNLKFIHCKIHTKNIQTSKEMKEFRTKKDSIVIAFQ